MTVDREHVTAEITYKDDGGGWMFETDSLCKCTTPLNLKTLENIEVCILILRPGNSVKTKKIINFEQC